MNETDKSDSIDAASGGAKPQRGLKGKAQTESKGKTQGKTNVQSQKKPQKKNQNKIKSGGIGIGFGTALMLSLLAGAGGAFGGWALGQYVMPQFIAPPISADAKPAKPVDLGPLRTRLTAAEKKLNQHASGLTRLTSQMNAKPTTISVGSSAGSLNDKSANLAPLLKRLAALEAKTNAPAAARTKDDAEPVQDAPVQASPDYSAEIEALRARLDEVERDMSAGLAETKALAAAPRVVKDPVLLPPFPRQAMLELMTTSKSAEGEGWLGKTLKKHISVRDPQEVARANEVLDAIEAASARADYSAALTQIQALPSQVRSAARDWSAAIEREVNSPQNMPQTQELGE